MPLAERTDTKDPDFRLRENLTLGTGGPTPLRGRSHVSNDVLIFGTGGKPVKPEEHGHPFGVYVNGMDTFPVRDLWYL